MSIGKDWDEEYINNLKEFDKHIKESTVTLNYEFITEHYFEMYEVALNAGTIMPYRFNTIGPVSYTHLNYNNISIEGVIVSNATDNDTDDDMNTVDNNTSNAYHFWYSKDNNTYHIFVKGKMNETFKESTIESIVNSTKILN